MNFLDVLKAQGLSEKQIAAIVDNMKRNKIFITYEEKIEERYQKMKLQRDGMKSKLDLIQKALQSKNDTERK